MSTRFKIVAATDGRSTAEDVIQQAFDQASRHRPAIVHVLRVIETRHEPPASAVDEAKTALWQLVRSKLEDFGWTDEKTDWQVRLHVRSGDPVEEIVELAFEVEPSLVVLGPGARGHGLHASVTDRVSHRVPCPVLVARLPDWGEKDADVEQCPACVQVRAVSEGERWFCEAHSGAGHLGTSTLLLSGPVIGLGHGPMW